MYCPPADGNVERIDRLAKEWNVPVNAVEGDVVAALRGVSETFDIVYAFSQAILQTPTVCFATKL